MAKLYFKYGSMGSSKTAQALITKYNYEENGMHVWLIKPRPTSATARSFCAAVSVWRPLPRSFRRTATFTSSIAAAKRRTSSSSTSASS